MTKQKKKFKITYGKGHFPNIRTCTDTQLCFYQVAHWLKEADDAALSLAPFADNAKAQALYIKDCKQKADAWKRKAARLRKKMKGSMP